ncbi:MAG: hypothetical protein NXI32_05050 [bacterium]|nr:hypothetical protein [bacterium]
MTEEKLQNLLRDLMSAEEIGLNEDDVNDLAGELQGKARTFSDHGVLTNNKGIVVEFEDGSEFQITIVQSKGSRLTLNSKRKPMAIRKKSKEFKKPVIDLTGPEGNAFCLLGKASSLAQQLGIEPQPILDEMMAGDYEHLIQVFDKHFGQYIDLER